MHRFTLFFALLAATLTLQPLLFSNALAQASGPPAFDAKIDAYMGTCSIYLPKGVRPTNASRQLPAKSFDFVAGKPGDKDYVSGSLTVTPSIECTGPPRFIIGFPVHSGENYTKLTVKEGDPRKSDYANGDYAFEWLQKERIFFDNGQMIEGADPEFVGKAPDGAKRVVKLEIDFKIGENRYTLRWDVQAPVRPSCTELRLSYLPRTKQMETSSEINTLTTERPIGSPMLAYLPEGCARSVPHSARFTISNNSKDDPAAELYTNQRPGEIRYVHPGKVTIRAQVEEGLEATATVEVLPGPCTDLTLKVAKNFDPNPLANVQGIRVRVGQKLQFEPILLPRDCHWPHDEKLELRTDAKFLQIDPKIHDTVIGKLPGYAGLQGSLGLLHSSYSLSIDVVADICTTMEVAFVPNTIEVGQSARLTRTYRPVGCIEPEAPRYTLRDGTAALSSSGNDEFIAHGEGERTVEVASGDLHAKATLHVSGMPCSTIDVKYSSNQVAVHGKLGPPHLDFQPAGCEYPIGAPTFTVLPKGIAEIDSSGALVGLIAGKVSINVAQGAADGTARISVGKPCTAIDVVYPESEVHVDEEMTVLPLLHYRPDFCERPEGAPLFAADNNYPTHYGWVDSKTGLVRGDKWGDLKIIVYHGELHDTAVVKILDKRACSIIHLKYERTDLVIGDTSKLLKISYWPDDCVPGLGKRPFFHEQPQSPLVGGVIDVLSDGTVKATGRGCARVIAEQDTAKGSEFFCVKQRDR